MDFKKDYGLEKLLGQLATCYVVHNTLFGLDDIHDVSGAYVIIVRNIETKINSLPNQESIAHYREKIREIKAYYLKGDIIDALDYEGYLKLKPKGVRGLTTLDHAGSK